MGFYLGIIVMLGFPQQHTSTIQCLEASLGQHIFMFKLFPASIFKQWHENAPEESQGFINRDKIKPKRKTERRKKNVIFQLEVTACPQKSQGRTNSTCLCQTDREGHRLRWLAGTRGTRGWGGSGPLEWDQWLSFNLRALYVGIWEYALLLLRAKRPEASTNSLTLTDWKKRKLHRCTCWLSPAKSFDVSVLLLRGLQTDWGTFGCSAKNNKQGGSCVHEEAGSIQESKMADEESKTVYQRKASSVTAVGVSQCL